MLNAKKKRKFQFTMHILTDLTLFYGTKQKIRIGHSNKVAMENRVALDL